MSLLPHVERELMRVAYAPAEGSSTGIRVRVGGARGRFSGAVLVAAVSVVALMIGAGFLVALHGASGGGGPATTPPSKPSPPAGRGMFPGAPHSQRPHVGRQGYVCRRAPRNHYLPRDVGCVSVLRAAVVGGDRTDLVVLYARLGRRTAGGFVPGPFTLEVVRPGGAIARTRVQSEPFPWITRVGNINGVPGDELVVHLDDISSGDTYGIYTFHAGRIELVHPLLSAGGDSAAKQGFICGGSSPREVVSIVMELLGPTIHGRWRWTVSNYAWHGAKLRRTAHRTFVSRGLPKRRDTVAGAGCGRPTGATQANP